MLLRSTLLLLLALSACKTTDPLYCDEDTPCTDPDRPYCDLTGEYPASDGHGRTCIADPFGDSDADAGPDTPDAAFCEAGTFVECVDGGKGRYCNEAGSEYVDLDCGGAACDEDKGGCFCEADTCSSDQTIHCDR